MNCNMSAMTEENCIISAQRPKHGMVIHRPLRCMDVQTAAAVNTKRNAYINIMLKKDVRKNKVMKINEQWETLKE